MKKAGGSEPQPEGVRGAACRNMSSTTGTARPNRFAGRLDSNRCVVVLDPDVARVFTTPESVNAALRALIEIVPQRPRRSRRSS